MSMTKRYRCNNCGCRFENEWYPPEEVTDAKRRGVRFGQLHCPECNRTDVREGWD